jgi:enoyl-CoA hydratase/carnithine racemase
LADLSGSGCGRLLAELDDLVVDPPRALLLRALEGVGAREPRAPTPTGLRDPAAVLASFPAPTVAVWNGPAVGAGAELLLAADLRIIGPDATMAFPEVGNGELPCWGGTQRLTRAGGVALALRMLVVGDAANADDLVRSGLAVLDADPGARAGALTEQLSRGAPRAQAAARDAVQRGRDLTLADALRLESDLNLLISTTDDRAEGIAAFFEKRPPRFTGS